MRFGTGSQLLYTLTILGLGLGAGWWLRGELAPAAAPIAAETIEERQPTEAAAPSRSPDWSPMAQRPPAPSPSPQADAQTDLQAHRAAAEPEPDGEDLKTRFRQRLDERFFYAAMDLYQEVARRSSDQASELKNLTLEYLESYLRTGDDAALTSLVDAFLSVYYDDIDVLLVLARYQQQSDYLAEAVRTYQLAFSYSATQSGGQQPVNRAFREFVEQVDQDLSSNGRWQELTRFYETLQQLDLTRPRYRLRQAELYLQQGESYYGYELLERLANHPAVGAQASAMLEDGAPPVARREPEPRQTSTDRIALEAAGSHLHLPLRLNNRLDVRLVIDTGASVTTLSRERFERMRNAIRFTELGPQVFNTAGGISKGTIYRVESLQLGQHVLNNVHIAVLDFNMPEGVDGLLGMNVLQQFRFEVDQDNQQLLVQPRPGN